MSYYTMEKIGRKWSVAGSFLVGGISTLAGAIVPETLSWLAIGKFGKLNTTVEPG